MMSVQLSLNVYAVIILTALLIGYVLEVVADILNMRAAAPEIPAEFADTYDADAYRKSQQYLQARTRFGMVADTCELIVVLLFWGCGWFEVLDSQVRTHIAGPIWRGLVYVGLLTVLRILFSLPFSLYSTFVLEERFGFNRTTYKTFVADLIKGLLLAVVIGGPLLAAILGFIEWAGVNAWLYCWAVTVVLTIVMQIVAPIWIMPLFNKFTPMEDGELRDAIIAYAEKVGFPVRGIFIMDGSRRSSRSNAFVAGLGRHRRIALFDTLVEQLSSPELVAVLAHEVGHWRCKHILKRVALSVAHSGVMFYFLSVFLTHRGLFDAFGISHPSPYTGLVFFGMLYAPVEMLLSLVLHAVSRRHELEADRFAAETTDTPDAMVTALKKLSVSNLANLTPHPFYVVLNHSHPPVLTRIQRLSEAPLLPPPAS